jgi:hypothetical protein
MSGVKKVAVVIAGLAVSAEAAFGMGTAHADGYAGDHDCAALAHEIIQMGGPGVHGTPEMARSLAASICQARANG